MNWRAFKCWRRAISGRWSICLEKLTWVEVISTGDCSPRVLTSQRDEEIVETVKLQRLKMSKAGRHTSSTKHIFVELKLLMTDGVKSLSLRMELLKFIKD